MKKSILTTMAEEKMKKAQKETPRTKGITINLPLVDHDILEAIVSVIGDKKTSFVRELVSKTIREFACNLEVGEWNTKTMEFELYTEEELKKFRKEGK